MANCSDCGDNTYNVRGRRGRHFIGQYWCDKCIHHRSRFTLDNTMDRRERFLRILNRVSRGRVVAPQEIYRLIRWFSYKVTPGRPSGTERMLYEDDTLEDIHSGWYQGNSLVPIAFEHLKHNPVEIFWCDLDNLKREHPKSAKLRGERPMIGLLLSLTGDYNAIKHC